MYKQRNIFIELIEKEPVVLSDNKWSGCITIKNNQIITKIIPSCNESIPFIDCIPKYSSLYDSLRLIPYRPIKDINYELPILQYILHGDRSTIQQNSWRNLSIRYNCMGSMVTNFLSPSIIDYSTSPKITLTIASNKNTDSISFDFVAEESMSLDTISYIVRKNNSILSLYSNHPNNPYDIMVYNNEHTNLAHFIKTDTIGNTLQLGECDEFNEGDFSLASILNNMYAKPIDLAGLWELHTRQSLSEQHNLVPLETYLETLFMCLDHLCEELLPESPGERKRSKQYGIIENLIKEHPNINGETRKWILDGKHAFVHRASLQERVKKLMQLVKFSHLLKEDFCEKTNELRNRVSHYGTLTPILYQWIRENQESYISYFLEPLTHRAINFYYSQEKNA